MYELFRAEYPDHRLAPEVEAALARSVVENAKQSNAGTIPEPQPSGWVQGASAIVVVQNDSPERLRITFQGPEVRVEELAACSACEKHMIVKPLSCPQKGPIGRYTLQPGAYDVVAEAISDRSVSPFAGNWTLNRGQQYSSCFYIVVTLGQ
jgi:hypothetical protein